MPAAQGPATWPCSALHTAWLPVSCVKARLSMNQQLTQPIMQLHSRPVHCCVHHSGIRLRLWSCCDGVDMQRQLQRGKRAAMSTIGMRMRPTQDAVAAVGALIQHEGHL